MDFSLIDDDDFDNIDIKNNENEDKNDKYCNDCDLQMNKNSNNTYICPLCGVINNVINGSENYEESLKNYNVNSLNSISIKCVGKNSYDFQKCIRINITNEKLAQENNIRKKLTNINFKSTTINIPNEIIAIVLEHYVMIKKNNFTFRGKVLNGLLAILIYYECYNKNIIIKRKEIIKLFCIKDKYLSKADDILMKLIDKKIITNIVILHNEEEKLITSYLTKLGIDMEYKSDILEIYNIIENARLWQLNIRTTTKITGILYLIVNGNNLNIKSIDIKNILSISETTFKNFYNKILKHDDQLNILSTYNLNISNEKKRRKRKTKEEK